MAGISWLTALLAFSAIFSHVLGSPERRFNAAYRHPKLRRRDGSFSPRRNDNAVYFVDDSLTGAVVNFESALPILILEDVSDLIKSIDCSGSEVSTYFHDNRTFNDALSTWTEETSFVVISSHGTCQRPGEHGVWIVHGIQHDSQKLAIKLAGRQSSIKDVASRMTVEFGKQISNHIDLRSLVERQDDTPTETGTFTSGSTPTATFTFQSPTASPTGSSLSSDISFSRINTTLIPPDTSIASLLPFSSLLENVRLSCQNCTLTGNIELVAGGFTTEDTDVGIMADFFTDGFLEFSVKDLTAMMGFELAFFPGFNIFEFTAQLPSIPLGAIIIAGVLEFGPVLDLTFPISVDLGSAVTLRTGFTLSAPPVTTIYLNMSDPEASYTTGFSDTTLDALPFTADAEGLSMNFTTGFKPQLVLGAGIGSSGYDASASGGIGVYLDLPQLAATLDIVDEVNENCEPATSDSQDGLIRVSSSVTYAGGGQWSLSADVFGLAYEKGDEVPWLSNTTALPTQCLAWDEKKGALIDAASIEADETSGDTGSDAGTTASEDSENKNAASRRVFPATFLSATVLCLVPIFF